MITFIETNNFKCLSGIAFNLSPLTVLTGTNSVGKSSLLQSILLTRSAALQRTRQGSVPLNGIHGLNLGEFDDILRHDVDASHGSDILFRVLLDGNEFQLSLRAELESARYAVFDFSQDIPSSFHDERLGHFTYLAADRQGPQDYSPIQSAPKDRMRIGPKGEFISNILDVCERDEVLPPLEHPKANNQRLLKQAEAWLSTFVPDVEVRVESAAELNVIGLRFKRGGVSAEWERSSNTGFGVSYCFPIVVAGLVAKPGSLLIIDSPEAHLHPSAQSAMGSFLSRLSSTGVQVLIETHSDHVLNGIRLAAVDDQHPLDASKVTINHLRLVDGQVAKEEVTIDANGNLSSRPKEFFDQAEHDISAIVRRKFSTETK
jgi:predicted ATPase